MKIKSFLFTIMAVITLISACSDPIASFIYECGNCEIGDTVQFTSLSTNAETFIWDFGDGKTSTEENPLHIYNAFGTFDIQLTVSSKNGSDVANGSVMIKGPSGRIIDTIVYSPGLAGNLLGDSPYRNVSIYLPPGYDSSDKHYPVVYLLHGYMGDNELWFGKGYAKVDLKSIMDYLINYKTINPMILVSPDSDNRFWGSWYINSKSSGNWEDFIVQDVVQFTDSNYRTIPNSESRGIAGHSMGGYGTIMIAMKNPDVFSTAYALSSYGLVFGQPSSSYLSLIYQEISGASDITDFDGLSFDAKLHLSHLVAMVPNSSSLPFYCDYLFNSSGEIVQSVWQRMMAYDPYTSILTYKENLLKLTAIKLDCGNLDDNTNGNSLFALKLATIGIENAFESYDGDHTNKLEERMELKVLPFFSAMLVHDYQ
jgi:S-formylglutathione hydrolase